MKEIFTTLNPFHEEINPLLETTIKKHSSEFKNSLHLKKIHVNGALKCSRTKWNTHEESIEFQDFSVWIINELCKFLKIDTKIKDIELAAMWGAIYQKGDYALCHNHSSPNPSEKEIISFSYMVNVSNECSPLIFPNTLMPWLGNVNLFKPINGLLIMWDADLFHYVPPQKCNHERITLAGNIYISDKKNKMNKIKYL